MKIKRLFAFSGLPTQQVIEGLDGKFYRFDLVPAREVTEKDLTELAYYVPIGERGVEAHAWTYRMYGLTKE